MSKKTRMQYICLCCNHIETIETTKEDYKEVHVCPKCKGALVDKWQGHKYKEPEYKPTACDHKFRHFDTKMTQEYFVTTGMKSWTRIDYFHCEKCLEEKEKRKSETSRDRPEWY